jgi:hypothetical protein
VKEIDHTVAHFRLADFGGGIDSARLRIRLQNIDPELPLGDLDVCSFFGDGTVSADEWNAGDFYYRVSGIAGGPSNGDVMGYPPQTFEVDITPLIALGKSQGRQYVSFEFRPGTIPDRYWMAPNSKTPASDIQVTPVPEPTGVVCLAAACTWSLRRRSGTPGICFSRHRLRIGLNLNPILHGNLPALQNLRA